MDDATNPAPNPAPEQPAAPAAAPPAAPPPAEPAAAAAPAPPADVAPVVAPAPAAEAAAATPVEAQAPAPETPAPVVAPEQPGPAAQVASTSEAPASIPEAAASSVEAPAVLAPASEPAPPPAVARWTIGGSFEHDSEPSDVPPAVDGAAKKDVVLEFGGLVKVGNAHHVKLAFPAEYDGASHHPLVKVRLYLIPEGKPLPPTADDFFRCPHRFSEHATHEAKGGDSKLLALPTVSKGRHAGVVLLGFAS